MNYRGRLLLSLAILVGSSAALQSQTTARTLSQNELKKQLADAHTSEQYRGLATYFSQQADSFRSKAREEKTEWDRRKSTTVSIAAKYPTPADSARNLYDYYTYKADEMAARSRHFESMAAGSTPTQ